MNKKADLAVTLLVFMTVALVGATLFIFINSSGKIKAKIVDARFMDDAYLEGEKLDYYINEIMEKVISETKSNENFEGDFPINFLAELSEYKINEKYIIPEFSQIQEQINKNPNIFVFEDDKVKAEFTIMTVIGVEKEGVRAIYTYTKKFEKQIKEAIPTPSAFPTPTTTAASADLTKKVQIQGSNTVYDGYYIYFNEERKEFFLIETLQGYIIMKEGSGDYYALIEEDKDWRIVTYPDKPLPEYLQGKKFFREGEIIYFKD